VASVGNAREFRSGRELAAFFGLVPRHYASGGRIVMLSIANKNARVMWALLTRGRATARLPRVVRNPHCT
jgi:transposase